MYNCRVVGDIIELSFMIKLERKLEEQLKTQRGYVGLIEFAHSINISLQTISFKSQFCIQ